MSNKIKISIVVGTRPEIIKMAPVIRACKRENINCHLIHTGQHYFYEMDKIFFEELELPEPDYNLNVGSGTHAEQTAKILTEVEKILTKENCTQNDIVLVEGDTNTVLATALAATKMHIKVGHVESGMRSYNKEMPEEINRIVVDHISDILFAPTENAKKNLLKEGIEEEKIILAGNTLVDSVYHSIELAKKKVEVFKKFKIEKKNYFFVTIHRAENTDVFERLNGIIEGLNLICDKFKIPIIFPIHPRTEKMIKKFNLKLNKKIQLIKPVGFLECLQLEANAKLILTDSGGVQEEACILKVPCITLRDNTEWPETVDLNANVLVGTNKEKMIEEVSKRSSEGFHKFMETIENPYGDGKAGERIVKYIKEHF